MLRAYIPIFLFVVIATGFAVFTILLSRLVHADKPDTVKLEPYSAASSRSATRAIATASVTTSSRCCS